MDAAAQVALRQDLKESARGLEGRKDVYSAHADADELPAEVLRGAQKAGLEDLIGKLSEDGVGAEGELLGIFGPTGGDRTAGVWGKNGT